MKKTKLSPYQSFCYPRKRASMELKYYNEYGFCRQCRGTENRHKMDCSYQFECIPPLKPKSSLDKIVDKIKTKHANEVAYKQFRKYL